jgi:hypothetical protein
LWTYTFDLWAYTFGTTERAITTFTGLLAGGTLLLWFYTKKAADAAKVAAEHIPTVERAYVAMSHNPPGLVFQTNAVNVSVQIRNAGRTPANVSGVLLKLQINPGSAKLPPEPDYGGGVNLDSSSGFLVSDKHFNVQTGFVITEEQAREAQSNEARVYLYGYVDYIDVFGARHRAGYARRYLHGMPENNLIFVAERAYNYDRVRLAGEGDDWD